MFDRPGGPHVESFGVVERRHHIPTGAAARHMIERHKGPGNMKGSVIGGRASRREAKTLGPHRHRRQDRHRIHFDDPHTVANGFSMIGSIDVRHRQSVVEKAKMELPVLERPGDTGVIGGRHEVTGGFTVPPGRRIVGTVLRLQETHHHNLSVRHRCLSSIKVASTGL